MDEKEKHKPEVIRDSRMKRGKEQFLVKWKGFSEDHNSWEFESPILSNLIKKFKKDTETNSRAKSKSKPQKEASSKKEDSTPITLIKVEAKSDRTIQYTFQQGKRRYSISSNQANNVEKILIVSYYEKYCEFLQTTRH